MKTVLIIALVVSWIIFVWAVLMMNPKGWLWAWLAGVWWWGDYWSKKSVETTLKSVAYVTSIIFVAVSLVLPYIEG